MTAAFVLLSDETLAAPAASMTAALDTDYRMFRVTFYGIKDGTNGSVGLRLNADSGANYAREQMGASSTTVSASRVTGATLLELDFPADMGANQQGLWTIEIEKPLTTTPARVTWAESYMSTTPSIDFGTGSGEWANTADLIDEITILASAGNFAIGSRLLIEGAAP